MNPSTRCRERGAGAGVIISASFMPRVCQVTSTLTHTGHTILPSGGSSVRFFISERILFFCAVATEKGEDERKGKPQSWQFAWVIIFGAEANVTFSTACQSLSKGNLCLFRILIKCLGHIAYCDSSPPSTPAPAPAVRKM